ncbi:lipopolysaccharide biosynthesis protein [Paenibacillus sp. GYB004]|uniref:lipopolysaccharide biosynthesis protein n=1 Tax=Paenibacillus sp. GYB004 TaxID=2994393 RepID=UPI002F96A961
MNITELKGKMLRATKWATLAEVAAKLAVPIINMILARLLAPEAFGIVATITMIISLADMFSDAGFQKYLVQYEFNNELELYQNSNVAFWTNLAISLFIWGLIVLFCNPLAELVGNPGLGVVIAVACVQLPLTSFSSIQMALYRRNFDYRTLFLVRLVSVCIPFIVSIPLALTGLGYWALIIGSICSQLSNSIILTIKSKWKPALFYRIAILKKMLSFSIWSLIEAISIWVSVWADTLIIGTILSSYYLGLYKTSTTMVNGLMAIITSAVIPVLFSALSRLQNNNEQFNQLFFKVQRLLSVIIFPLGVGVYLYSDLATNILLGSKWNEASQIIGQWALTSALMIVFGNLCSEVYRAKGRPKLSFSAQVLHIVVLIPVCIISAHHGFWALVLARSWIRLQFIMVHFILLKTKIGIPIGKIFTNTMQPAIAAIAMGLVGYFLRYLFDGVIWSLISILICVCFYIGILFMFPSMRREIANASERFLKNKVLKFSAREV